MAPRVLISDALSPAALAVFETRGVEVDFQPNIGKDKERLADVIGGYDGLAIRSSTKVTRKILDRATHLKVIGRAGIGLDNVDIPVATAKGVIVPYGPLDWGECHKLDLPFDELVEALEVIIGADKLERRISRTSEGVRLRKTQRDYDQALLYLYARRRREHRLVALRQFLGLMRKLAHNETRHGQA